MKGSIFIILLTITNFVFAQKFNVPVSNVKGDLNKDGLEDIVIVTQDTISQIRPYKLEIYFTQPDGKKKLIVSTIKAIEPGGDDNNYNSFDTIAINNGVLSIDEQLLRGHYTHKFRFQNGSFELIGYSEGGSDGNDNCSYVDFNLSTGIRTEEDQSCSTDKIISSKKRKVMIRPLPKLQNFEPNDSDLY
jgi:hypothetical protein